MTTDQTDWHASQVVFDRTVIHLSPALCWTCTNGSMHYVHMQTKRGWSLSFALAPSSLPGTAQISLLRTATMFRVVLAMYCVHPQHWGNPDHEGDDRVQNVAPDNSNNLGRSSELMADTLWASCLSQTPAGQWQDHCIGNISQPVLWTSFIVSFSQLQQALISHCMQCRKLFRSTLL